MLRTALARPSTLRRHPVAATRPDATTALRNWIVGDGRPHPTLRPRDEDATGEPEPGAPAPTGLSHELLSDRNFIRTTLDRRWKAAILAAAGNTGLDYLALLCARRAVGASPQPSLVILAYASAELLAQIPFTPGGLGFVEAGLVGTLTLAGVPAPAALAATLLYRLVSYWLPDPGRWSCVLLFRHRYRVGQEDQHRSRG